MQPTKTLLATISILLFFNLFAQTEKTTAISIAFNTTLTTPLLNPPNISAVISDPIDPAKYSGIVVDILEDGLPILASNYTLAASSSKSSVVANSNVAITKSDGYATIKITPSAVGYANITLTLTKSSSSKTLVIKYAVSAASTTPASTYWHTGFSDASAVYVLDSNYMVVGDDEINNLYVVNRKQSGLPIQSFSFANLLGLTDMNNGSPREVDVEACAKSIANTTRVYWIGSLANAGSSNVYRPNANKIFATSITGTAGSTSFNIVGYYSSIRQQLITWGNNNGYNFTASTADGHDAKTIDGFNVEGMCFAPDNSTLYIGFRAPLVPTANRTKALIAPLLNFETWFNNGNTTGNPTIGSPIEINLGGRGIRDMVRLSNGIYIIVAGNYDNTPLNGAIFKWTGLATDVPIQITSMDISTINAEACAEITEAGQMQNNKLQIITDNGSTEFYGDGTEAKDLSENNYKKFRSDIIAASTNVLPLKLDYFIADRMNNNIHLKWKINDAGNLKNFAIYRSYNNSNFIPIATVASQTNKSIYTYTDNQIATKIYYRIGIFQKDGLEILSNTIALNAGAEKINIYPNPAKDFIHIIVAQNKKYTVEILNNQLTLVKKESIIGSSKISINHLIKGFYLLVLTNENNEQIREKIIVQ